MMIINMLKKEIIKTQNDEAPADVVKKWLRNKETISFLGVWEELNNENFKVVEFDQFKNDTGRHAFTMSPQKWIRETNAIGIISKSGKYLDTSLIKCVNVGGEMAPNNEVRPIEFEWVKNLYLEAKERNIEFYYHQSGSRLMRNGKNIGKWNLKEQIKLAEEIQHELENNY